jgi:uncharacterized protein (TIGR02145 family)
MDKNMTKTIIQLAMAIMLMAPWSLAGQVVVGEGTPDPSAILDVQGTDKGFLFTRLSTAGRNAIVNPARGLIIFNTGTLCLEINQGTPSAPQWERVKCRTGAIGGLDCGAASVSEPVITVPYTGGNGGVYDVHSASSTGITGLSATLPAGNYTDGTGSLSWVVSGVPSGPGTATFSLSSGGYSCSVPFNVVAGSISSLDCAGATTTGTLTSGQAASGVSASVPYTGGNGGFYGVQTASSTGVTGLTVTLDGGFFAIGTGNLTFVITGTPASGGTASFALNIDGQTCALDVFVCTTGCCAKVSATEYKNFMCHNLGSANTSADPFTPTWEINGSYWQWGRLTQAADGPTDTNPGSGAVSGWNTTSAANGSWADGSKTANDPCPPGFRVPTNAQWDGVLANNTKTDVGTSSNSATNYGAGKKFGDQLMLPAAGSRLQANGLLNYRGSSGFYWSSTENFGIFARELNFFGSSALTADFYRTDGLSVRCIEDTPGAVGALDCSGANVTGTLSSGQAASGVSASVPYTGGDGGFHSGQTVTSTGVTGLTATLSAGNFGIGAGNLSYVITGTPASGGTASFALNIVGQTCTLDMTVCSPPPVCRAKVTATDYKNFMCYNLGAANTCADPFTPSWEINGGYWQWGRLAQAAAGPTATDPNSGAVSGWNTTDAADGSWTDGSKTPNDPCPTGYRVPTEAQWVGVVANNTITSVGSFTSSATNYESGKKFGDQLMLPAAGLRGQNDGAMSNRGSFGIYWSSTRLSSASAFYLRLNSSITDVLGSGRRSGYSVRCVAE